MQAQAQSTLEKKDAEEKLKDLEQEMGRKDLEQKMERIQAQAQAALEKKDLEHKMETMQAQAHAALERKEREQKMEKNEREQQIKRMSLKRKDRERKQQIKRMEADVMMRAVLENEKRDRMLENEKRDREADKKDSQHQIEQLKWEVRFGQMEQQQAARAYNIQQIPNPLQHATGTALPLVPQKKRVGQLQPVKLQEIRPWEEETGPSHSMTPVTATPQPLVLPSAALPSAALPSAALPSAALPSAALPSLVMARSQAASVSQPVQHQHQSTHNTPAPSRPLQQQPPQQQVQQQHQVTAGPAARAGPVPLPANARMHFFLSHCQGTGGDQTNAIYLELKQLGFSCW
jgi:hypothetical protein